jgi:phage protein D
VTQQLTTTLRVDVAGTPLPDDVALLQTLVVVDNSLVEPDMFVLNFRDPDRVVLAKSGLDIGVAVSVNVVSDAHPGGCELLRGEVTALEVEFSTEGTSTVVRGFDLSHRLFRGRTTVAYRNATYADVVRTVAQRASIPVGTIDSTPGVYTQVVQANVTDWDFLKRLAAEVGYRLDVVAGTLNFRAPGHASEAPGPGTLDRQAPFQVVKGGNLLALQATLSAADQVAAVEVRAWDEKAKQEIVGHATGVSVSSLAGVAPAALARKFGGRTLVSVSTPHDHQSDADAEAAALAEHIGATSAELYAVVRGDPLLVAGAAVSLALVGDPFDGKYRVSTSRHVYEPSEGYTTQLTVSGDQGRSLLDLTSGGVGSRDDQARIDGVVPAIVTDANDPEQRCRVKVRFPWLSGDYESEWARTVQPGAGRNRGAVVVPEVNDEVLVAFEQGDVRRPFVLGGIHNGVDLPNVGSALVNGSGQVDRRGFISRKGHALVFFDGMGKEGVALLTGDKAMRISLNKTGMAIKISSSGDVEITGTRNVKVESGAAMTVKAGTTMAIEAGAKLDLKAPMVTVTGNGPVQVKGTPIQLN